LVYASTLDNNVAPSVESISNRGHRLLLKNSVPEIRGHIAFFAEKLFPDFRG